jgi:hypothetical protein
MAALLKNNNQSSVGAQQCAESMPNTNVMPTSMFVDAKEHLCTQNASTTPNTNAHALNISEMCSELTRNEKISTTRMEDSPTVEGSKNERKISEKNFTASTTTHPKKKRRESPTSHQLPPTLWIHRFPHKKKQGERYKSSTFSPTVRNGIMEAFNLIWIQPTQNAKNYENKDLITENFVQGGKDENSFYVRQLNQKTSDAVAMVLARNNTVFVAMLRGFHEIFESFNKGQADRALPNKDAVKKITPDLVRGIAHRIALDSGFPKGVGLCRCLPLAAWNAVMQGLYNRIPQSQQRKANKNPLKKIMPLVTTFNDEYEMQNDINGLEATHDVEMYEDSLNKLINACAVVYLKHGASLFKAALAKIEHKHDFIKSQAGRRAAALKKAKKPTAPVEATTTVPVEVSEQTVQIQINHLVDRINSVAEVLRNCAVATPAEHVCREMLTQPSAYMKYVGKDVTCTVTEMMFAIGDRHGSKNDLMAQVLGQRSSNLWIGCITLVLAAHKKGLDCSKIAGEANAEGTRNKISGYDANAHMGTVTRATIQGSYKKVKDTFKCQHSSILKHASAEIKTSWKVASAELNTLVLENFPDDSGIAETFARLQLFVGQKKKVHGLIQTKHRTAAIQHLKWVWVLYCEMLPTNQTPTTDNFISVMLSPMGVSLCSAYLAWVATGMYRLKVRALSGLEIPSHINLQDLSKKPSIENTLFGTPADDLIDVLAALVYTEWSPEKSILASVQQNAKQTKCTPWHANTNLGRSAAAWMYWLLGSCRIVQHFAPRPGILEQIQIITKSDWEARQPGLNDQAELRLGLFFILDGNNIEYSHAHKVTGSGGKADPAFDAKAAHGFIKQGSEWSGIVGSTTSTQGKWDASILQRTFRRYQDAARIIGGDPLSRKYIIDVKDPLTNKFKVMTSAIVSSPVMPVFTRYHAAVEQEQPENRTFEKVMQPLTKLNGQGMKKHLSTLKQQGIVPTHRPPTGCLMDNTLSKGKNHTKTAKRVAELFKHSIAPAIASGKPILMDKLFNLNSVPKSKDLSSGKVVASSVYKFMQLNVASKQNMARFGISEEKLKSVRLNCIEIAAGRLHVHPNWFGRQTKISQLISIRACLRQIPDWDDGEAPDRRVVTAITNMAADQLHETMDKIVKVHYCDVHKTELGNPVTYFAKFDERIRAHPVKPIFSLQGIQEWPSTTVEPHSHEGFSSSSSSSSDSGMSLVQKAWTDVRLLTVVEQNMNMTCLTAYRDSLQWIIDNQTWLSTKEPGIIDWFNSRANYDPMEMEVEPQRRTPRAKKRKRVHDA